MELVRKECFLNAENWAQPTTEEFNIIFDLTKLGQTEFALMIDVDPRTVRRWVSGEKKVKYMPWAILCEQTGIKKLAKIWVAPKPKK